MVGKNVIRWQFGLFGTAGLLLAGLNACGGGSSSMPPPPPVVSKIQHVVIIFQENRSTDNLFQDQNLINAGADIVSSGKNSKGDEIPLTSLSLASDYGPDHSHTAFLAMYDNGKMDGADKVKLICNPGAQNCPPPNGQYTYVPVKEAAPYFQMAETYTFADRMFQTNQGPSFPAHQYILSGASAQNAKPAPLYASENPNGLTTNGIPAGCIAPQDQTVPLIDLLTGDESQTAYPCFEHAALTDNLDAAKISWKWYTAKNDPGSIWNAPNAIQHICVPNTGNTSCTGTEWTSNVILDPTHILTDIQNGQLPSVTWVIPDGVNSDHPGSSDNTGPAWVASIVNAIGNSQYWTDTAIFISWDDWGGWYDHVAPPIHNFYEYGFRVPLIVVSPYAKAKYISHTTHHFGSILKFIEQNWGLPAVGTGTYSDAYSDTDDLSDCFDYSQTPLTFTTIQAAKDRQFFLHDHRPATLVDDD
jgi:phospholipase C